MKNLFRKLRQIYGDMSLQSKFTLALMVTVTVPVLMIGLFFYNRLYDMVVSYTIQQEQDASAKTAPQIERTVQEVTDTYHTLTELPFFQTLFHQPVNTAMSSLTSSAQAKDFQEQIREMTENDLITGVRIYVDLPNNNSPLFTSSSTEEIFAPVNSIRGTYWHGIFQGSHITELYAPSFYLGTQEQEDYGDMAYIRSISLYFHEKSYPAYAAVYYSSKPMTDILSQNLSLEGSVSYIINERDALVASSDAALSGIYWLSYNSISESVMSSNNFIERTILDNKIYAGFYRISQSGWFMVTVLPSKPLIGQGIRLMMQYVLFYFVFMVLALILANRLAHSITNRISSVITQMGQVRKGSLLPMPSPVYHDEVGDLIDTYNFMTRKMDKLIADQGKAAEDLRIAEFNSLQAQINPHFLYNTMDMINWLAQQGRNSEVIDAVQNLSRFYKLTLSRKQSISTIAQEEEHVSIYVHLQNMRFHDGISFVSDIPDELMDYPIPKLTLQPVIENAILHGILETDHKTGTIVLTGWMEENDIVLLISDDGVGIPPEKLSNILTGNDTSSSGGSHIAIYNTHRRLQILYGSRYGLTYSSEPGKGTEVQIRLPAQKEYQSPFVHNTENDLNDSLLSLAMVSSSGNSPSMFSVTPESLLEYSQKMTKDLYSNNIHNLHQIFRELPSNESFYILTHEVSSDFPNHTHDYFELSYLSSGSLINVIDGNEIYMEAGDLVMMNRNAVHSLRYQQQGTLLINFCLKEEFFDRTLLAFYHDENLISGFFHGQTQNSRNYIFFSLGHSLHAQSILTSIIQEYADNGFHQSFALESYFLLLFTYLINAEEYSYYGIDNHTHQMIQYILKHALDLEPEEIAGHFHISADELNQHLKKRTGRNLAGFIREVRLNCAVHLLSRPTLNIYQIVKECGYEDSDEFFEDFQNKFHISPTEYRKQFL